jgi:hypothetical protein
MCLQKYVYIFLHHKPNYSLLDKLHRKAKLKGWLPVRFVPTNANIWCPEVVGGRRERHRNTRHEQHRLNCDIKLEDLDLAFENPLWLTLNNVNSIVYNLKNPRAIHFPCLIPTCQRQITFFSVVSSGFSCVFRLFNFRYCRYSDHKKMWDLFSYTYPSTHRLPLLPHSCFKLFC